MDSTAFVDNGTSLHYFKVNALLQDVQHINDRVSVTLLNNETILSTHCGYLPIIGLTQAAQQAEILPGLEMSSLLSVSQLYDGGCIVVLTETEARVTKYYNIIFCTKRNK